MITAIDIKTENIGTINKLLSSDEPLFLVSGEESGEKVILPDSLRPLLKQIFAEMVKGNEVTVLTKDSEMTTQEAADYLKVSQGYVVRIIDRGEIPSRMVGNQRQLKVKDVLLYEMSMNERKKGRVVAPPVKMCDMSKDMRWLAEHRHEYAGKWVAIYEDRLVASGDNAKDVYAEVDRVGLPQTMVTYIENPFRA